MESTRRGLLATIAAAGLAGCFGGGGGSSSPTANATATATDTTVSTPTWTPTETASPTESETASATDSPTDSPTPTDKPTETPTETATSTPTPASPRTGTWVGADGHKVELVVTDVFSPMTVESVSADQFDGQLWVSCRFTAHEQLEQAAARMTATGDGIPRGPLGNAKIDAETTAFLTDVKKGERDNLRAPIEYHEGIERVEIVLDDKETGPNETPTATETPCEGIWCS